MPKVRKLSARRVRKAAGNDVEMVDAEMALTSKLVEGERDESEPPQSLDTLSKAPRLPVSRKERAAQKKQKLQVMMSESFSASKQLSKGQKKRKKARALRQASERDAEKVSLLEFLDTLPNFESIAKDSAQREQRSKRLTAKRRAKLEKNETTQFHRVVNHPSFKVAPLDALQTHLRARMLAEQEQTLRREKEQVAAQQRHDKADERLKRAIKKKNKQKKNMQRKAF